MDQLSDLRHLIYLGCFCRETGLGFMKDITTSPVFKPWELAEIQARMRVDRAVLETQPNVGKYDSDSTFLCDLLSCWDCM